MPTKMKVVCRSCGSEEGFVADANAHWDVESQEWTIGEVWEKGGFCNACDTMDARWDFVEVEDG